MLKKIVILFFSFCIVTASFISVQATALASTKTAHITVCDVADLLNENEEQELYKLSEHYEDEEISVVFLTQINTNEKSSQDICKDFRETEQLHSSGVIFLINMDAGEIFIDRFGLCINTISTPTARNIINQTYKYPSQQKYITFFKEAEKMTRPYALAISELNEEQARIPFAEGLLVSCLLTVIFLWFALRIHNKANQKTKAKKYLKDKVNIINKQETYTGSHKKVINGYYRK